LVTLRSPPTPASAAGSACRAGRSRRSMGLEASADADLDRESRMPRDGDPAARRPGVQRRGRWALATRDHPQRVAGHGAVSWPATCPSASSVGIHDAGREVRVGSNAPVPDIRARVLSIDPLLPLQNTRTMEERLAAKVGSQRLNLLLLGAFALQALTLAAVGIYGITAHAVRQRTDQIELGLALGAGRVDILTLVVGQGMQLVIAGAVVGLAGAWALTRVIAGLLFGISWVAIGP
jgi:hypothetical protein